MIANGSFTDGMATLSSNDIDNALYWNAIWSCENCSTGDLFNTTSGLPIELIPPVPFLQENFGSFWCWKNANNSGFREGILNNLDQNISNGVCYNMSLKIACLNDVSGTPIIDIFGVPEGAVSTGKPDAIFPLNQDLFSPAAIRLGHITIDENSCDNNFQTYELVLDASVIPDNVLINRIFFTRADESTGRTYIAVDDVCVHKSVCASCENNIIVNGDFTSGLIGGDLNKEGNIDDWFPIPEPATPIHDFTSPQVNDTEGGQAIGSIIMWGNQVVGEGIYQQVYFEKGSKYNLSISGAFHEAVKDSARIRIRATNNTSIIKGSVGNYQPCNLPECEEVWLSPILDPAWTIYNSPSWIPSNDYNTLVITVWNEYDLADPDYVSWVKVDDICISKDLIDSNSEILREEIPVTLFPTPASNEVNLRSNTFANKNSILFIYNSSGKMIFKKELDRADVYKFSIADFPNGIYFVQIYQEGFASWSGKIIKQ